MKTVGITTWFQFTQEQCLFCHEWQKKWQNCLRLFCRFGYYFAVDLVSFCLSLEETLPHLHVKIAVHFAQILKIFAQIIANFSALGMRPHPLHPLARRLWSALPARKLVFYGNSNQILYETNKPNPFSGHRAYLCRFEVVIFQAIQNIVF